MSNETEEQPVVVEKPKSVVEVFQLTDPTYASQSDPFLALIKRLYEQIAIPSVRYESLHNEICGIVQVNFEMQRRGVPEKFWNAHCQVGVVDGVLKGFSMFRLLPNRIPHIQTIEWPYCISDDVRVFHKFVQEVRRFKKLWGARYIAFVSTNPKLDRAAGRLFKKAKAVGTCWVAEDIREKVISGWRE